MTMNPGTESIAKVPYSVGDCEIVYFCVTSLGEIGNKNILRLTVKLRAEMMSVWIKPPLNLPEIQLEDLQFFGSDVFRFDEKLPTVSLPVAMRMFLGFLQVSPKPALLVTHSPIFDSVLLVQAIIKSGLEDDFDSVIAGFVDTFPMFRKKYPNLSTLKEFKLSNLMIQVLKKSPEKPKFEATAYLEYLEELVSVDISKSDLVKRSLTYEKAMSSEGDITAIYEMYEELEPLAQAMAQRDMRRKLNGEAEKNQAPQTKTPDLVKPFSDNDRAYEELVEIMNRDRPIY
ncbi:uncharacterized protein [Venturia canescens]|uniref:uncharacterized protein n=1 Tax=Venturia canescens TaxID=32260 RepID=UPI001C9CA0D1|nr:uncharacterized protein LOC122406568 [Venturia canescens]